MNVIEVFEKEGIEIRTNVPGVKLSTFKTGGPISAVVYPKDINEVKKTVEILTTEGKEYEVIGNGSNLLISDSGYDGFCIRLKKLDNIDFYSQNVKVGAGVNLPVLLSKAENASLSGLEWFFGIPSGVGGAVKMNAGCFGHNISEVFSSAEILCDSEVVTIDKESAGFGYRTSVFDSKKIVLQVNFLLKKDNYYDICIRREECRHKRELMPKEPSLGSVFKRENDKSIAYFADVLDMKGMRVGRAEISQKHSGFIVNLGGAKTMDFVMLASYMQRKVFEEYGILFKPEVKFLGKMNKIEEKLFFKGDK